MNCPWKQFVCGIGQIFIKSIKKAKSDISFPREIQTFYGNFTEAKGRAVNKRKFFFMLYRLSNMWGIEPFMIFLLWLCVDSHFRKKLFFPFDGREKSLGNSPVRFLSPLLDVFGFFLRWNPPHVARSINPENPVIPLSSEHIDWESFSAFYHIITLFLIRPQKFFHQNSDVFLKRDVIETSTVNKSVINPSNFCYFS